MIRRARRVAATRFGVQGTGLLCFKLLRACSELSYIKSLPREYTVHT